MATIIINKSAFVPPQDPNAVIEYNSIEGPQTIDLQTTTTATFSGTASNDPDGTIVAYSWTVTAPSGADQTPVNNATSSIVVPFNQIGNYTVSLQVTDNVGNTGTTTTVYNITGTFNIEFVVQTINTNQSVTGVNANGVFKYISYGANSDVVFTNTSNTYTTPGTYTIKAFVENPTELYLQYRPEIIEVIKVPNSLKTFSLIQTSLNVANRESVIDQVLAFNNVTEPIPIVTPANPGYGGFKNLFLDEPTNTNGTLSSIVMTPSELNKARVLEDIGWTITYGLSNPLNWAKSYRTVDGPGGREYKQHLYSSAQFGGYELRDSANTANSISVSPGATFGTRINLSYTEPIGNFNNEQYYQERLEINISGAWYWLYKFPTRTGNLTSDFDVEFNGIVKTIPAPNTLPLGSYPIRFAYFGLNFNFYSNELTLNVV